MQSATETADPSSLLHPVFFNQRGLRAGWRLFIFGGILYAMYYGLLQVLGHLQNVAKQAGTAGTLATPSELQFFLPIFQGVFEFVAFGVVLLLSWLMSRMERRSVGEYGFPLRQSAPRQLLAWGLLLGFLSLFATLLALRALHVFYFGHLGLHGAQILVWGLAWGFAFLGVAFLEEYLFRGYALYTMADGIGFWPAAVIMGLFFGRAHMGNGGETYIGIAGTILFALFASAMLRRTGSLWLAVGVHAGWDWGQSFFFGVNDSGFQAPGHLLNPHVQGPAWLSGGTVGPEGSIVTLIVLALMTAGFLALYRERRRPVVLVRVETNELAQPPV
jgi:CAAX protease family protein